MKIVVNGGTGVVGSKPFKSLRSLALHLPRLHPDPPRGQTPAETDGPDQWQDDGVVGMRGWYY